jgi:hypothetical protein
MQPTGFFARVTIRIETISSYGRRASSPASPSNGAKGKLPLAFSPPVSSDEGSGDALSPAMTRVDQRNDGQSQLEPP